MRIYLVDSSVFVGILREDEKAKNLYESLEGKITTSAVCIAELYEGIFRSKRRIRNEKSFLELLSTFDDIIPFGVREAKRFGELKVKFRQRPIPDLDVQIAATCIEHQMVLVTYDARHFGNIVNLSIYEIPKKN